MIVFLIVLIWQIYWVTDDFDLYKDALMLRERGLGISIYFYWMCGFGGIYLFSTGILTL